MTVTQIRSSARAMPTAAWSYTLRRMFLRSERPRVTPGSFAFPAPCSPVEDDRDPDPIVGASDAHRSMVVHPAKDVLKIGKTPGNSGVFRVPGSLLTRRR